jgi:transcriptional regulator with XRE-family HTH domain
MRQTRMAAKNLMTPEENRTFFKTLGPNLAALRKRAGLTQVQVAELLGYSQTQVAAFESGRRRIPVSALPVLADAYGATLEELLAVEIKSRRKRGPRSKLERQVELVTKLPKAKQRLASEMLDAILAQPA